MWAQRLFSVQLNSSHIRRDVFKVQGFFISVLVPLESFQKLPTPVWNISPLFLCRSWVALDVSRKTYRAQFTPPRKVDCWAFYRVEDDCLDPELCSNTADNSSREHLLGVLFWGCCFFVLLRPGWFVCVPRVAQGTRRTSVSTLNAGVEKAKVEWSQHSEVKPSGELVRRAVVICEIGSPPGMGLISRY